MCVLSASGRLNLKFPAAHLQWRANSGGGVARAFPRAVCTPRPSTSLGDYPVPWADTVYTACFRTVGPRAGQGSRGALGGEEPTPRLLLGAVTAKYRGTCAHHRSGSSGSSWSALGAHRPSPGRSGSREGGGLGGAGYVNDTSPVRGLQAGATGGGGGTARGGGAERERAGVGGGRGPGAK